MMNNALSSKSDLVFPEKQLIQIGDVVKNYVYTKILLLAAILGILFVTLLLYYIVPDFSFNFPYLEITINKRHFNFIPIIAILWPFGWTAYEFSNQFKFEDQELQKISEKINIFRQQIKAVPEISCENDLNKFAYENIAPSFSSAFKSLGALSFFLIAGAIFFGILYVIINFSSFRTTILFLFAIISYGCFLIHYLRCYKMADQCTISFQGNGFTFLSLGFLKPHQVQVRMDDVQDMMVYGSMKHFVESFDNDHEKIPKKNKAILIEKNKEFIQGICIWNYKGRPLVFSKLIMPPEYMIAFSRAIQDEVLTVDGQLNLQLILVHENNAGKS